MTREEKLANRLLVRHSLVPPFDLEWLVKQYAQLEYERFPFIADGVTIGVKTNTPRVFINKILSERRANFTLAHELGHIILPWHIGTIVSDIDNYSPHDHYLYREKETEANRFAAELLMPTNWVSEILIENESFEKKILKILQDSNASLDAILIKIMNICEDNRYLLIMNNDLCRKQYRTKYTKYFNFEDNIFKFEEVYSGFNYECFDIADKKIVTFQIGEIDKEQFKLDDHRNWREILQQMLADTEENNPKVLHSTNAVLATHFSNNKHKAFDEICAAIRVAYAGRPLLENLVEHHLFPIYIRKRVEDLLSRQ